MKAAEQSAQARDQSKDTGAKVEALSAATLESLGQTKLAAEQSQAAAEGARDAALKAAEQSAQARDQSKDTGAKVEALSADNQKSFTAIQQTATSSAEKIGRQYEHLRGDIAGLSGCIEQSDLHVGALGASMASRLGQVGDAVMAKVEEGNATSKGQFEDLKSEQARRNELQERQNQQIAEALEKLTKAVQTPQAPTAGGGGGTDNGDNPMPPGPRRGSEVVTRVPTLSDGAKLYKAVLEGAVDQVRTLTAANKTPDSVINFRSRNGSTLLIAAAHCGNAEVMKIISDKFKFKIDINAQDANGWTALWIACFYQDDELIKHLLAEWPGVIDTNLKPTQGDYKGVTPLRIRNFPAKPNDAVKKRLVDARALLS